MVFTVDMVDTVDTVDTVATVDTVNAAHTIQAALHCLNSSMYDYIYCKENLKRYWADLVLSIKWEWMFTP